jgi:putative oligomerization/nucleic acid binding protein
VVTPARRRRSGLISFFKYAGALFALAGVAMLVAAAVSGDGVAGMGLGIVGFTFAMIGVIWVIVALGLGGWYGSVAKRQAQEAQLFQTGERATAVIEGVEGTGVSINDCPQVYLTLRVKPSHGAEFVHQRKIVLPFGSVVQPGYLVDVAYDPANQQNVALDVDPRYVATPPAVYVRTRPPEQERAATAAASDGSPPTLIDQLERLAKLRDSGALTEAEFEEQKKALLGG